MVNKDNDFTNFVWYIHKNAIHHQIVKKVGDWKYDSYLSLLSSSHSDLLRNEIMEWFGSKELFIQFHQQQINPKIDFMDL